MDNESCRILVLGSPFTPIMELGERLSEYHNLDFITLEGDDENVHDYFGDNIPANYVDMGDISSGSGSMQMVRGPREYKKMKELAEIYVNSPDDFLTDEERCGIGMEDFAVVSSEIPDPYLVEWANAVILLVVDESHAVEWINKRRKCPCCGAVYHLEERPVTRKGYCDRCGSHIFQEERDLPESVRAQYRLWGRDLWKIEKRMREKGNYVKVDVGKFNSLKEIVSQVDRVLRKILNKPHQIDWSYNLS
ncbi:hypothetical protein M0P65_05455 [Candidatus Gracilibacteria bacterium]|nr:hypothetical protein [Candidatus Gracilibacteria bacterium]